MSGSLLALLEPPAPFPARSETSLDLGLEVLAWSLFRTGRQTGKQGWCGAGKAEAWPSLRALGPIGKCAPELGRKRNRVRVDDSPGSPGMGTLLHLVQKYPRPWFHVELQTLPAGAAGSPFWARFHLCPHQSFLGSRESGNTEELNSFPNSGISDRRKGTLEKAQPGYTSSPATVWTCYVKLGSSPPPPGLTGASLQQDSLHGPECSDTV